MPIFEYRCGNCSTEFETLVRNSETPECPECENSDQLEKLLSAPNGHVAGVNSLPITGGCPPSDEPPCSPTCCRL